MWSSPAALEKVKSSASRLSSGPQSFCPQPAYHFRTTSSVVKFCPPTVLALASPGRLTALTSAQAPVASRFLRDTVILVIVPPPFHDVAESVWLDRDPDWPRIRCGCPAGAETSASP